VSCGIISEERLTNHFFLTDEKKGEILVVEKALGCKIDKNRLLIVELCLEIAEDGWELL